MKLTFQKVTISGYNVQVPVLVNTANLKPGDVLTWDKSMGAQKGKRAQPAEVKGSKKQKS